MGDLWVSGFSPRFLSAATRCSATNMLAAGSDTLADYFETRLGYVDYPAYARLSRRLAGENPAGPRVVTVAKETSHALSQIHFVYLDVGCWAGNGGEREWPRHREFGLVHGYLALLCAFVGKALACPHYSNPPPWRHRGELTGSPLVDAAITRHPDWPPVRQLLDRLQGGIPGSTLRVLGGHVPRLAVHASTGARRRRAYHCLLGRSPRSGGDQLGKRTRRGRRSRNAPRTPRCERR